MIKSMISIMCLFNKLFPQTKLYYVTHIQGRRQVVSNILKISNKSDLAHPTQVCKVNLHFFSTILKTLTKTLFPQIDISFLKKKKELVTNMKIAKEWKTDFPKPLL